APVSPSCDPRFWRRSPGNICGRKARSPSTCAIAIVCGARWTRAIGRQLRWPKMWRRSTWRWTCKRLCAPPAKLSARWTWNKFWTRSSASFASANEMCALKRYNPRSVEPVVHMKDVYERVVRRLLFALDPETAHRLTLALLRSLSCAGWSLKLLELFQPQPKPRSLFGLNFPNPIGVAAGLDKNGVAPAAWAALGFGFIEIGTVTAQAQPGNPKPRLFRLPEQQALINRLGFNNAGAAAVAARLRNLREHERLPAVPIGINIGKSRATPLERATDDYLYSFRLLREFADYVVLNVSSPNTPGLRELQEPAALSRLMGAIRNEPGAAAKPILGKISPDL